MCDKKRFEQPELTSSQVVGVITFLFEVIGKHFFPWSPNCSCEVWEVKLQWTEVASDLGPDKIPMKRKQTRHRALLSCVSEFSLELVHGLLVHISCSVSVDPTFGQGGNTRHAGTFCDERDFIHYGVAEMVLL